MELMIWRLRNNIGTRLACLGLHGMLGIWRKEREMIHQRERKDFRKGRFMGTKGVFNSMIPFATFHGT